MPAWDPGCQQCHKPAASDDASQGAPKQASKQTSSQSPHAVLGVPVQATTPIKVSQGILTANSTHVSSETITKMANPELLSWLISQIVVQGWGMVGRGA